MRSLVSLRLENNKLETYHGSLAEQELEQLCLMHRLTRFPSRSASCASCASCGWLAIGCAACRRVERLASRAPRTLPQLPYGPAGLPPAHRLRELWLRGNALREVPACLLPGPGALETLDLPPTPSHKSLWNSSAAKAPLASARRQPEPGLPESRHSQPGIGGGAGGAAAGRASMAPHAILATTAAPSDGAAAATAASVHVRRMLTLATRRACSTVNAAAAPRGRRAGRQPRAADTHSHRHPHIMRVLM